MLYCPLQSQIFFFSTPSLSLVLTYNTASPATSSRSIWTESKERMSTPVASADTRPSPPPHQSLCPPCFSDVWAQKEQEVSIQKHPD